MKKPQMDIFVNKKQLAHLFDADEKTIYRWVAEGGPQRHPTGFSLREWIEYRCPPDGAGDDYHEARRRRMAAQAGREEIRLSVEKKRFISVEQYERKLDEVCRWFVQELQRLPNELSLELANKPMPEIKAILQRWADGKQDKAFGGPNSENRENASKDDKQEQRQS